MPTDILSLDSQIRRLERQQRIRAGNTRQYDSDQFVVSATCPPSTSIYFIGGMRWWNTNQLWGHGYFVPSYTVDLTDPEKVSCRVNYGNYTYTFTNPYWYAPCVIILNSYGLDAKETWPADPPDDCIYLGGTNRTTPFTFEEFATAAEAETALLATRRLQYAQAYGTAATGLILRNNGNTTLPNQYMPIDPVNRERSYLFWQVREMWIMG
jgi:hypothetical protein